MVSKSNHWIEKGKQIEREFSFKNFVEAMRFVSQVAEIAEAVNHHPDILIQYNKVKIMSWSHDVNGLSDRDYKLAAKIDAII